MAASQGSRGVLVTALVIAVIAFFVAAFYAWQNNTKAGASEQALKEFKDKYARVLPESELPRVPQYMPAGAGNKTLVDALRDQVIQYRTALSAGATTRPHAIVANKLDAIRARLNGVVVPAANPGDKPSTLLQALNLTIKPDVLSNLDPLTDKLISTYKEKEQLQTQLAAERGAKDKAVAEITTARDTLKPELDKAQKALADAVAARAAIEADYAAKAAKAQKDFETKLADAAKANQDVDDARKKAEGETARIRTENEALTRQLGKWRPKDLAESPLRQPDGKIVQIGSKPGVVYIDLGIGKKIYKGMTFEIYDKTEGVPRMAGTTDDQLPPGKGSLEVINPGPGESECRIIHMQPGQAPVAGDIIANLIYDPVVKWRFKIYGQFDIDGNSVATSAETDVLKRLVVEWGGAVTEAINVDTDFVVLGKEPSLPPYTKAEAEASPWVKEEMRKAEEQLKQYDEVRRKALELGIPVMNQNRFLYLIGYYDQARR